MAIGFGGIGLIAASHARPAGVIVVMSALAVAGTVDLLGHIRIGPNSAYAWVTVAISAGVGLVVTRLSLPRVSRAGRRTLALISLFPVWALATFAWTPLTSAGLQNALVYLALPALASIAAGVTASGQMTFPVLRRALFATFSAGSVLYVGSLLVGGFGGSTPVGARSYALFATVGVAWCAALYRYGYKPEVWLGLTMLGLTLMSLSRTGFASALLVSVLALLGYRTPRALARTIAVGAAAAVVGFSAVSYSNSFSARFAEGDVVRLPTGVAINVTGRAELWRDTWNSALNAPITGHGPGTAETAVLPNAHHPHNDYLRVFHDFGIIGLSLLALALLVPFVVALRAARAAMASDCGADDRSLFLAAALVLLAFSLGLVTDNSLVYLFVVAPTAVIVGASLGRVNLPHAR
jgi:O-antigen ligase